MTTQILFPYRKKLNRRSLVASMTTLRRINQPMTKSPSYTNTCIPCDHPRSFIPLIEAVAVTCQHGCCSRLKFCVTRPSASRPDCLRLACFVSAMLVTDAQPLACPTCGFLCCRERRLDSDPHTASVTMDGKRSSAWIAWSTRDDSFRMAAACSRISLEDARIVISGRTCGAVNGGVSRVRAYIARL